MKGGIGGRLDLLIYVNILKGRERRTTGSAGLLLPGRDADARSGTTQGLRVAVREREEGGGFSG